MTARTTVAGDPRSRRDGLGWVTRALFGDERIALTVGGPPPPGHRAVARYAVVPSLSRARFLLPLDAPRATAASLLAYNALRPWRVRAVRAALGALARVGAIDLAPFPRLTVSLPDEVAADEVLLTGRLGAALGAPAVYAACGVRPPDPNHKPTLQLFAPDGRALGYAKIGWNGATRALVTAEAAALRDLATATRAPDHPAAPRLLAETAVGGQTVALVEPLPPAVRGVAVGAPPRIAALLAVARRGSPPEPPRQLAGSPFLVRLTVEAERAAASAPDGGRAVTAVAALARRHGGTAVEFGHWHGDWVPWNLGVHAGRLVAWDWEHSGPGVPLGFDLAHEAFQRALLLRDAPAAAAALAVDAHLDRYGAELGLGPAARGLVADAYLLEMWLRVWRLADAGAGWNAALHPALLDVIEERRAN